SEIMMIATVVTAVAIPTFTPISTAKTVTNVGKIIFAILFPIKIVVINSLGFVSSFDNLADFLSSFSASVFIFILFAAVRAVSLIEKIDEASNSILISIIIIV